MAITSMDFGGKSPDGDKPADHVRAADARWADKLGERFTAIDPAGKAVTLYVRRETFEAAEHDSRWMRTYQGRKRCLDGQGRFVQYVAPGVFETADGVRLTTDDPIGQ